MLLLNSLPPATKNQYKSVKQPLEEALKLLCQAQSMAFVHFNQSRGWVLKLAKIEIENIFFSADVAFFIWPCYFRPCLVGPRHSLS